MSDLRKAIRESDDTVFETITIPEWKDENGTSRLVTVRSMSGRERDEYENGLLAESKVMVKGRVKTKRKLNMKDVRAKLVVVTVCNAPGDKTRVFTDDDVEWLTEKNGKALDALYEVASRLSGLTDEDLEELTGN